MMQRVMQSVSRVKQMAVQQGQWLSVMASSEHRKYCEEMVRRLDREGYQTALLLPKDGGTRNGAIAVRALNAEVSQIRDSAREPMVCPSVIS